MMRAAVIEDGVVVNIAVAETGFAHARGWVLSEEAQIGWSYDGEVFAPPAAPAPVVPQSVGPYQARAALHMNGLLAGVEALVADPATDQLVKVAWEYATEIKRNSQFIAQMQGSLGLTDQQLDDLFILAATLDA